MDKDLYDLASNVNAKVTDANVRAKGTAVMNAFPGVVLHERHTGPYAGSHGITIYGPASTAASPFAKVEGKEPAAPTRPGPGGVGTKEPLAAR